MSRPLSASSWPTSCVKLLQGPLSIVDKYDSRVTQRSDEDLGPDNTFYNLKTPRGVSETSPGVSVACRRVQGVRNGYGSLYGVSVQHR
ncbi:unnamed protein product [Cuscuta campestris]|uniref:Uncharacterized protein n=1 Tax=Cuscuta campestris TaxID=132261 RepID=A0A484L9T8_9ASTE|nr:unnamed protein product [Cuscuta campestris]